MPHQGSDEPRPRAHATIERDGPLEMSDGPLGPTGAGSQTSQVQICGTKTDCGGVVGSLSGLSAQQLVELLGTHSIAQSATGLGTEHQTGHIHVVATQARELLLGELEEEPPCLIEHAYLCV